MGNGKGLDNIDKLWSTYDSHDDKDRVIAWERQAATNIIMAGAIKGLQCKEISDRIEVLEKAASRQKGAIAVVVTLWVILTTLLVIFW
jgi:hypothetical protein